MNGPSNEHSQHTCSLKNDESINSLSSLTMPRCRQNPSSVSINIEDERGAEKIFQLADIILNLPELKEKAGTDELYPGFVSIIDPVFIELCF